jgi:hypothetical protein
LWQDPAVGVAMANTTVTVENDAGVSGLAGRVSTALAGLGYQVGEPITGSHQAHTRLVDRTGGQGSSLSTQLSKDLGLAALDTADPPADDAAYRLILQLGADAADLKPTAPSDSQAPRSVTGVVKFGAWP